MAVFRAALLCLLFILGVIYGQSTLDTYGTYFRMAFMDNFVDYPIYRPVDLHVCNRASTDNMVTVTIPHLNHPNCHPTLTQNVLARRCFRFQLCEEIRHTYADGSLANKVVEVFSEQDISVQGFNVERFSADSYAILPWSLNGHVHFIMSYTLQSIQTQFAIVAKEKTKIRVVIPDRPGETITVDYRGLRFSSGQDETFELEPNTTFLAQSAGDLSGVMLQSWRPVAVFTGNVRSFNDYNKTSRDHLVEQVPPTSRWGSEFIYVPTPRSMPGDTLKIIAFAENTAVNLTDVNGVQEVTVGKVPIVLNLTTLTHITARRVILVAVFTHSQNGKEFAQTDPADPSMYFLPSVSQYDSEYFLPKFQNAKNGDYRRVWVLIAVPGNHVNNLRIDGSRIDQSLLKGIPRAEALGYRAGAILVSPNSMHRILMTNSLGIMAVAYGASDRESFASTLGYKFESYGCEETDMLQIRDNLDNDCDGLFDEETCGDNIDNDKDGLMDEDCADEYVSSIGDATGTKFAIVFMSNVVNDLPYEYIDQIELYIAPLEKDTVISISAPAYNGPNKPVFNNIRGSPGSVLQIPLNSNMRQTPGNSHDLGQSTTSNKGISIISNKRIVVYGINKKQYSTDGFLALPISVLGSEYYAFCNSPLVPRDDRCQFAVVAIKDNTVIMIEVLSGITLHGIDGGASIVGPKTEKVTLNSYQVLEVQSLDDITGTRVYSEYDVHFSFFSGNVRTKLPLTEASRDHLVEQLPPTETWGYSFSTMSTPRETNQGDLFKIIAKEPATVLNVSYFDSMRDYRQDVFTLQRGGHRDIIMNTSSPVSIKSNKPILVVQIAKSAPQNFLYNDPSAIVVVPQSRWSSNYRFVTPLSGQRDSVGNQLSYENFLILTIRKVDRPGLILIDVLGNRIMMNDESEWMDIPGDPEVEGIVYSLPRGQGQTSIINANADAKWMALIFGKANRETYGNAIGMSFTPHCSYAEMIPGDGIDNDCDGEIDEEIKNYIDDDGDGQIDEDLDGPPKGYTYILAFEENLVEYPRNYALEIYVGQMTNSKVTCRMETPGRLSKPTYDTAIVVYDPAFEVESERIQFAVSPALRTRGTTIEHTAIRMTCNDAVTIMGINKETFSTDAFIVLEERALDTEYYTVSYSPATLKTQFAVVAVNGGTTNVMIQTKAQITYQGTNLNSLNIQLNQYQVFQAQSKDDLTGSHIKADRPVAVFSGNVRTNVLLSASRDHLAAQLPPTTSWGTRFHLVPTSFRAVGDVFRIVARYNNTIISWSGNSRTLNTAGDYVELNMGSAHGLQSSNPVMVMQYAKSQDGAFSGEPADPCSHIVSPLEHYTNMTTVITPLYSRGFYKDKEHYTNYMTLIIPDNTRSGIRINGMSIGSDPDVVYANVNLQRRPISGSSYAVIDLILLKPGLATYHITHTNQNVRFSGYMIGVADRESYCVPIGQN